MKKRILILSSILVCLSSVFLLFGCGDKGNQFTFKDAEYKNEIYSIVVSNDTEEYSLLNRISVNDAYTWSVAKDEYGLTTFTTKIVPLVVGDNNFYIIVMDKKENSTIYQICIRRKPLYKVIFNTSCGSYIDYQEVEEGFLATEPNSPSKKGYEFSGWDYDFTQQVNSNITINATWTAKNYSAYCYSENDRAFNYNITFDSNYILDIPKKKGYSFDGWYLDEQYNIKVTNSQGQSLSKWTFDENVNLYANFIINKYNVLINKSISSAGSVSGQGSYNYGSTVNLLAYNTQKGYVFKGWFINDTCLCESLQYQFVVDDKNYQIEAKWELDLGGTAGTVEDPYIISSINSIYAIELLEFHSRPLANFKMIADIDLSGYSWYYAMSGIEYQGVFDGNGYAIKNINKSLFSRINYSTIKNLTITNATLNINTSYATSGILVGYASYDSLILNCKINGNITCSTTRSSYIGGIVGESWGGIIKNSYFNGTITATHSQGRLYVGGLAGSTNANIENCYSSGKINTSSANTVICGGIAGYSSKEINNSFSIVELKCTNASEDMFIGGILGQCTKLIDKSYFNGNIHIESSYSAANICIGGLAGYINYNGKIDNSFADISIKINYNLNSFKIGAIVGEISEGTINNAYMLKRQDYNINDELCEYDNSFYDYELVTIATNIETLYEICFSLWDNNIWTIEENRYPEHANI